MKKLAILSHKYSPTIDAIKKHLEDFCEIELFNEETNDLANFDLVIAIGFCPSKIKALCSHYSLLPAFGTAEPVAEAFLAGVKVTGITIYFNNPKTIIAQYPIFISNESHFDEVEMELNYIEQTLFPIVIEKVLKNEPFESKKLLTKNCNGNCGGCSGCNH